MRRLILASVASGWLFVLIVSLIFLVLSTSWADLPRSALLAIDGSFFVFLFGWPVASAIVLVSALTVRELYRVRNRRVAILDVLLGSALLGGLSLPLAWLSIWGRHGADAPVTAIVGAVGGVASGLIFWVLARPKSWV